MIRITHYFLLICFFGGVLTGLVSCTGSAEQPAETAKPDSTKTTETQNGEVAVSLTQAQYAEAAIAVGQPERHPLNTVLKVSGTIDVPPQNMVTISVPFGGYIRRIPLEQGMHVRKGQPLVVLENPDYIQVQQDYLDMKAKLEYADLDYARQEELARDNVSALKIFQQTRANRQSLQAQVAGLAQRLTVLRINPATLRPDKITRTLTIPSPVDGFVTSVPVNAGKFVNPADVIAEITNLSDIHLRLSIFEKDLANIKLGQKLRFGIGADAQATHTAEIFMIGKSFSADRTVFVLAHPDSRSSDFIPGAFVSANISVIDQSALALPDAAIVTYGGKQLIYTLLGHTKTDSTTHYHFQQHEVKTGTSSGGYTAITLPAGIDTHRTPVVIRGAYSLLSQINNREEE